MRKIIIWTINLFLLLIAFLFFIVWIQRLFLDYNSEGRYFDKENHIVYEQYAVIGYGILAFFFLLVGLVSLGLTLKR